MQPIQETAERLGLRPDDYELYGGRIAKVAPRGTLSQLPENANRRLILVSAITPTSAGEGKTTTSIGLAQGLARRGQSVCVALREPSLGPCFGVKGGGTGGGKCQLVPADRINLHFTGDFHAVTSAHNLLAAMLDNHLYFGNELQLDPRRVVWRRVIDMNDRALRHTIIGLGGRLQGVPRETGFDITAASEVMAMLCLADDEHDMRQRLDRTIVGYRDDGQPVTVRDLKASGAMLALLRDALRPNLVATTEGVPALVHGGPFANIAHGCSSVAATRMSLSLVDWTVTEAGFGFDLGAEKFFDIKCRSAGLDADLVVLVATVRALKLHGGAELAELETASPAHVRKGLPNLQKHLENIARFGKQAVVAVNVFPTDSADEIRVITDDCAAAGVPCAAADHFRSGGAGADQLAETVMQAAVRPAAPFQPLYDLDLPVVEKIQRIASSMYGARDVELSKLAKRDLRQIEQLGFANLPVCMAKTHSSLSDNPSLRGRPQDFVVSVDRISVNAGAGFLVVMTGDINRMPGLSRHPSAERIDLVDGRIQGLT